MFPQRLEVYPYGFNGKEQEDEVFNEANDFGMREYDGRLGRFFNLDPAKYSYPFMSPYCFAANNPIKFIDRDGQGPQDPPNPFQMSVWGDWYSMGYRTTEERKFRNTADMLTLAALGSPGMVYGLLDNFFTYYSSNDATKKDNAVQQFGRDAGINTMEWMMETAGETKISKFLGKLGPVITAYDIYNEIQTDTRVERLTELTIYVAQLEFFGVVDPSTDHSYLKIPNTEFSSKEEASQRLNQIYNKLDDMFKTFDLSNNEDYKVARKVIGDSPGFSFKSYFETLTTPNNPSSNPLKGFSIPENKPDKGGNDKKGKLGTKF